MRTNSAWMADLMKWILSCEVYLSIVQLHGLIPLWFYRLIEFELWFNNHVQTYNRK